MNGNAFDEFLTAAGLELTNEQPFGKGERVYRRPTTPATIRYTLPTDEGIEVELTPAGRGDYGRQMYRYTMRLDGAVLFEGDSYGTSARTPEQIALGLLAFLTLQPGDTDEDYFDEYTPAQLEWARSFRCECAKGDVSELEDAAFRR